MLYLLAFIFWTLIICTIAVTVMMGVQVRWGNPRDYDQMSWFVRLVSKKRKSR